MQNISNDKINKKQIEDKELRLLSINAARKILGIRHQTLTEIIREGKIKIIYNKGRIMIPRKNLDLFIDTESKTVTVNNKKENNRKAPQSAKFILESIIKKHQ